METEPAVSGVIPKGLRVEYKESPTNAPPDAPRFSWRIEDEDFEATQRAYRVLVARSADTIAAGRGDCWDSGRVESGRSVGVAYDAVPLSSNETYHWTVRVWNDEGETSEFAESNEFSTALAADDWDADWIAHQPDSGDANGFRTEWRRPSTAGASGSESISASGSR